MQALLAKVQSDESLKAALGAATTTEEALKVANDAGFDVSLAELAPVEKDLSDEELEGAAGGIMSAQLWGSCSDTPAWGNCYR